MRAPTAETVLDRMKGLEPGQDAGYAERVPDAARHPQEPAGPQAAAGADRAGVVLGVAFVAGSFMFTDTPGPHVRPPVHDGQRRTSRSTSAAPRRPAPATTGEGGRRDVPAGALAQVRAVDGVAEAQGNVVRSVNGVRSSARTARCVGTGGAADIGVNWIDSGALDQQRSIAAAAAPTGRGEVALDAGVGRDGRLEVGDAVTCSPPSRTQDARSSARRVRDGKDSLGGEPTSLLRPRRRRSSWLGRPDGYTAIASPPRTASTPGASCATGSPPRCRSGIEAMTGDAAGRRAGQRHPGGPGFINMFLLVFAGGRAVRRHVHHPQHVLDPGRPAHPRARAAAGAGRQPAPGHPVGAARGARRRPHRRPRRARRRHRLALGLQALFGAFGVELRRRRPVVAAAHRARCLRGRHRRHRGRRLPAGPAGGRVPPVAAMRTTRPPRTARCAGRPSVGAVARRVAGAAGHRRSALTGSAGCRLIGLGALLAFVGVALLSPLLEPPGDRAAGSAVRRVGCRGRLAGENALPQPPAHRGDRGGADDRADAGRRGRCARRVDEGQRPTPPWTRSAPTSSLVRPRSTSATPRSAAVAASPGSTQFRQAFRRRGRVDGAGVSRRRSPGSARPDAEPARVSGGSDARADAAGRRRVADGKDWSVGDTVAWSSRAASR